MSLLHPVRFRFIVHHQLWISLIRCVVLDWETMKKLGHNYNEYSGEPEERKKKKKSILSSFIYPVTECSLNESSTIENRFLLIFALFVSIFFFGSVKLPVPRRPDSIIIYTAFSTLWSSLLKCIVVFWTISIFFFSSTDSSSTETTTATKNKFWISISVVLELRNWKNRNRIM